MKKLVVYIQREPDQPMHEHCLAAWQGFKWLGYEVIFSDNWLPTILKPEDPIVGSVEFMQTVLTSRGWKVPAPLNVPDILLDFAGRKIERNTLRNVIYNTDLPVFLKPADSHKLFPGGIITNHANAKLIFADQPLDTQVLVSPEIEIVSEYRVFVDREKGMVSMRHYAGEPFIVPDYDTIKSMMAAYKPFAPRTYSLDVGVVEEDNSNRQHTIVVECNDFWALGTYGFDPVKYVELLALRWYELVNQLEPGPIKFPCRIM